MAKRSKRADQPAAGQLGPGVTIRGLEAFVAVAKTGSMVAAAKELGLTQPAISQTIASLEGALGIQLFDRSVRPPALTLQGASLIKRANAITEAIREFQGAVRLGASARLPLLRIGMLNSFATSMGPHVIRRLHDVAVEWAIDSGFRATRFQSVVDRDFDFIITADEGDIPDGVKVMPVLTEPFLIVVPSSYRGDGACLKRLSENLDLIRFGRDPRLHARIDHVLQKHKIVPQRRYHLDTNEAVLTMVAMGAGWTILPPLAVFKSIERGDSIRALPFAGFAFHRTLRVVSQKSNGLHIATKIRDAAIEALKLHFLPSVRISLPHIARQITLHTKAFRD